MLNDFSKMEVLVTGGTRGIGLATAVAFAKQGARCTITYSWGSAEDESVLKAFEGCAHQPRLIQADVSSEEETTKLLEEIAKDTDGIDILISSVAMSTSAMGIDDYNLRALQKSLQYTAWPMVDYVRRIKARFCRPPRYVLGYSCPGPDFYFVNYDMVAACKAVMETWARYLTYRLTDDDCCVNVIRTEWVDTESLHGILGEGGFEFAENYFPESILPPEAVANASLALCSGLMDAVRGQVINIDRGSRFYQNVMYMNDQERFK
jgi:NAD(P)-dependent dehydrogenase (short-subunit alcohol dehydrogenase family)